jgi:hypothetical protein
VGNKYVNLALNQAVNDGKIQIVLVLVENGAILSLNVFKNISSVFMKEDIEKIVSNCSKKFPEETITFIISFKKYSFLLKYFKKEDFVKNIEYIPQKNYEYVVENGFLTSDQIWDLYKTQITNPFQTQGIIVLDDLRFLFNKFLLNEKNQEEFRNLFGTVGSPISKTTEQHWTEYSKSSTPVTRCQILVNLMKNDPNAFEEMLKRGADVTLDLIEQSVVYCCSDLFAIICSYNKIEKNLIYERLEHCSNKMAAGLFIYQLT